jgi:hypothetical protein
VKLGELYANDYVADTEAAEEAYLGRRDGIERRKRG